MDARPTSHVKCSDVSDSLSVAFPDSKILLGSIERAQLQAMLTNQLSRTRRLKHLRRLAQNEDGDHAANSSAREVGFLHLR